MSMADSMVADSIKITHAVGLHARPSVKLTKLAKTFAAHIELALSADGPWIDAKSIVKVMATKAPQYSMLYLRATGSDAKQAIHDMIDLVRRDFDEAPHA
jgi:phosphocarrier protein HPr